MQSQSAISGLFVAQAKEFLDLFQEKQPFVNPGKIRGRIFLGVNKRPGAAKAGADGQTTARFENIGDVGDVGGRAIGPAAIESIIHVKIDDAGREYRFAIDRAYDRAAGEPRGVEQPHNRLQLNSRDLWSDRLYGR